jgi:hypothetical protein
VGAIEFEVAFVIGKSTKLQKLVWKGEMNWVLDPHLGKQHMPCWFYLEKLFLSALLCERFIG